MAEGSSLSRVMDKNGFLANREVFDRAMIETIVGDEGVIHGVEFELPLKRVQISQTRKVSGVTIYKHFYLANLYSGLKFPLSKVMIRVLVDFNIALF